MKLYIPDFINLDKLTENGYLNKKINSNHVMYNYTDKCVYEKLWNEHTINSRGTIYNKATGEIVARALPKFYNLTELQLDKIKEIMRSRKFEVFTKEDGSMGLVAYYNGKWSVTTRGSFESDQAIKATQMLEKYNLNQLNKNFSYIVEIIYPENRIIVNYGSKEELVLLACIETKTGREADLEALKGHVPFPIVQSHKFKSISDVVEAVEKMDSNNEGFVIKLKDGSRFKVKSPEYLKVARLIGNTSPLVLWESMKDGKVDIELMESIPEEFRQHYEDIREKLENKYFDVLVDAATFTHDTVVNVFKNSTLITDNDLNLESPEVSKEIGIYLKNNPNDFNVFVFPMVKQKQDAVEKIIMKLIKPVANVI